MMRDEYVAEMRLKKLDRKNRSKIHKKWRWDVTIFRMVDGANPGVKDTRYHIGSGGFGYCRTKRGALREIARAYEKALLTYPMQ